MPPFVHYAFRNKESRDYAADEAFDFLAGLRLGRRVTRSDLEAADNILDKVGIMRGLEPCDLAQARVWLDLAAQVDENAAVLKDHLDRVERKNLDLLEETQDLAADLERRGKS